MNLTTYQLSLGHFTTMPNQTVRDGRLSFKARGLLTYVRSFPPGVSLDAHKLADASDKDGRSAVLSAIAELREFGYYHERTVRGAKGLFSKENVYCDVPIEDPWAIIDGESSGQKPRSENLTLAVAEESANVLVGPRFDYPTSDKPTFGEPTSGEPTSENPTIKEIRQEEIEDSEQDFALHVVREEEAQPSASRASDLASLDADARVPRKRARKDQLLDEAMAKASTEAVSLAEHIVARFNAYAESIGDATRASLSASAINEADLLLRKGPHPWEDRTAPAPTYDKAAALVSYVFDHPERNDKGFSWADNLASAAGLRSKWLKIAKWANAHHDERKGSGGSVTPAVKPSYHEKLPPGAMFAEPERTPAAYEHLENAKAAVHRRAS